MATGWQATRLAIVTFIVPFLFVYMPVLLMMGSGGEIALAVLSGVIGVFLLAAGMQGYLVRPTGWLLRVLLLAGGIMMMVPDFTTDLIGAFLGVIVLSAQLLGHRRIWKVSGKADKVG